MRYRHAVTRTLVRLSVRQQLTCERNSSYSFWPAAVKPKNEINHQQHKHRTVINHNKRTDLEWLIIILALNFHCGSKHLFVWLIEQSSNSLCKCVISPEPQLVAHTSILGQTTSPSPSECLNMHIQILTLPKSTN